MVADTLSSRLFTPAIEPIVQDDSWTTLVAQGVTLVEQENVTFWARGDLCLRVDRAYGEGSIKKFSSETGLGAAKSCYEAAQIAEFFKSELREHAPSLRREHWRVAFRAVNKSGKSPEDKIGIAMAHLKQAEDQGWTAARMGRDIKLFLGEQAKQRWQVKPVEVHVQGGYLIFLLPDGELERLERDVLPLKSKPTFDSTLSFSFTHAPIGI